jgi:hypothetical protein
MRLAIVDSWPNLSENAEKEFIKRFQIACARIDVECYRVVTSSDVESVQPDAVLVSHEFSRKLWDFPTIGLMWSPLSFYIDDPYRVRSIKTYDGYLVGNTAIRNYVSDLSAGEACARPIGPELFLPTTYKSDVNCQEEIDSPSLCYVGVHWDGERHRALFEELARRDVVTVYGPQKSWDYIPERYGGYLPFDGISVMKTLAKHGAVLCLHKDAHRKENTPSMRVFEACSVGAIPICDDIEFARRELADIAFFVEDMSDPTAAVRAIETHLEWIRSNPELARERGARAKEWFETKWSLESKIANVILPLVEQVSRAGKFSGRIDAKAAEAPIDRVQPECEIIIRCGGRDPAYVKRALASLELADSADMRLGALLVDYSNSSELRGLADAAALPVRYILSKPTGCRSTALWDGLKAARAKYVAQLDDDDTVFQNHYRQLRCALEYEKVDYAYSGVIQHEDDPGVYVRAVNFAGPRGERIREVRSLRFLEPFNLVKLARFDNYIQSNAWMARTEAVQSIMGEDPFLCVAEDVYLYLTLARMGPFSFTGRPTAVWHWRSRARDNSMTSVEQEIWTSNIDRIKNRLSGKLFKSSLTWSQVHEGNLLSDVDLGHDFGLNVGEVVAGAETLWHITAPAGFRLEQGIGLCSIEAAPSLSVELTRATRSSHTALEIVYDYLPGREDGLATVAIAGGEARPLYFDPANISSVTIPVPRLWGNTLTVDFNLPSSASGQVATLVISSLRLLGRKTEKRPEVPSSGSGFLAFQVAYLECGAWTGDFRTAGTLYLRANEATNYSHRSADGRFSIPAWLANEADFGLFVADDPYWQEAQPIRLTLADQGYSKWTRNSSQREATIEGFYVSQDQTYSHSGCTVPVWDGLGLGSTFVQLQQHHGELFLLAKPEYGRFWQIASAGHELDPSGECRIPYKAALRDAHLIPIISSIVQAICSDVVSVNPALPAEFSVTVLRATAGQA